mmetsp:Transcript_36926/g.33197  ORF Transcript_36926/g.33197 Transcript_36926/m.33197 type:complete len:81 (+) Transcript_36926:322-564(+)
MKNMDDLLEVKKHNRNTKSNVDEVYLEEKMKKNPYELTSKEAIYLGNKTQEKGKEALQNTLKVAQSADNKADDIQLKMKE